MYRNEQCMLDLVMFMASGIYCRLLNISLSQGGRLLHHCSSMVTPNTGIDTSLLTF